MKDIFILFCLLFAILSFIGALYYSMYAEDYARATYNLLYGFILLWLKDREENRE